MAAVCHDSRAEQNGRSIRCATLVLANWSQAATALSLLKSLAFASDAPAGRCDVPAYYVNPTNHMRPAESSNASRKFLGTNGHLIAPLVGTRGRRFKSCHSDRH